MRYVVAAVVVTGMMELLVPAHATGNPVAPQLVVRLYDAFGVAPSAMATARTTASGVFKRAGIDIVWRDCEPIDASDPSSTPCDHAVEPREVLVRIVTAGSRGTAETLGYSFVDVHQNTHCLATVLADRVSIAAARAQSDMGTLLGRVLVHEIGHLLLGTTGHSLFGLMRARWSDEQVQRGRPADWMLSRGDATQIRLRLLAR